MNRRLFLLSGFLGEPEDYQSLREHLPFIAPENLHYIDFREAQYWTSKERNFASFQLPTLSRAADAFEVYVGYSLGARLLAQYCHLQKPSLLRRKLLCIGCGLGVDAESLPARKAWEEEVLAKIAQVSFSEFLSYWNALPLFAGSRERVTASTWNREQLALYFKNFRQSEQPALHDFFAEQGRALLLVGERDNKYREMYRQLPHRVIAGAGHRIPLDEPARLAAVIEQQFLALEAE